MAFVGPDLVLLAFMSLKRQSNPCYGWQISSTNNLWPVMSITKSGIGL